MHARILGWILIAWTGATACDRPPEGLTRIDQALSRIVLMQSGTGVPQDLILRAAQEVSSTSLGKHEKVRILKAKIAYYGDAAALLGDLGLQASDDLIGAAGTALSNGVTQADLRAVIAENMSDEDLPHLIDRFTGLIHADMPPAAARVVARQETLAIRQK